MGSELAERLLQKSPKMKVIYTSGYSPGMAGKDISLLEGRNFLPQALLRRQTRAGGPGMS